MRVAALYDIHGNLPALEAVLGEVREAEVDQIVIGGDVLPGPMVRETLGRLFGLDIAVLPIQGNCEVAVLAELEGRDLEPMPDSARAAIRWSAEVIGPHGVERISTWPKTRTLQIPGVGSVLFCHGTPRHENEIFTRKTPAKRLAPVFRDVATSVVVCGHTHMQFDRMVGGVRVLNAGSVGMPFGRPGADWLLLGPDAELRHTNYDLMDAADRIRRTDYPQAEEFAAHYVLAPPSEAQMLEAFGRAELRYSPGA
ncbi:MAG TPA: metallophosphoesterase family protein [Thermoanaerobaculia bacterium]|nr:metallophosphoesterase family protein [Thermoanaerobaculia bacterium]